jgi:hypothetical protein
MYIDHCLVILTSYLTLLFANKLFELQTNHFLETCLKQHRSIAILWLAGLFQWYLMLTFRMIFNLKCVNRTSIRWQPKKIGRLLQVEVDTLDSGKFFNFVSEIQHSAPLCSLPSYFGYRFKISYEMLRNESVRLWEVFLHFEISRFFPFYPSASLAIQLR